MSIDVKRSNHNPFRTPTVSPNPTGAGPSAGQSQSSNPTPSPALPASTSAAAPSVEPVEPRRAHSPVESLSAALGGTSLDDGLPPEPPPAYTPAADSYTGEATVEYGPTRPFQRAPAAPPLPPQFTGMSQPSPGYFSPQQTGPSLTPTPTGWGRYPGGPRQNGLPFTGPPPRHPSSAGRGAALRGSPIPAAPPALSRQPLSDFARDFYAAGSDAQIGGRASSPTGSNASSDDARGPEHHERGRAASTVPPSESTGYAPPVGPPPSRPYSPYAPPPGRPQHPSSPSNSSAFAPPPGPPPPPSARRAESNRDDLKPTTTPIPGRPLLNRGNVLLYPAGHECRKCLNTGYKNFDPSHPCRKCWDKYGRAYAGPIIHAPHSPQSQRPLPTFRPPHLRHGQSSSQPSMLSPPSPASNFPRSQSASRSAVGLGAYPGMMPGAYPGRAASNPGPLSPPGPPSVGYVRGRPPPGTTIVRSGDSRIGGRLCWRCGGDGTLSFLIFDVSTCPVCNGLGRTLN